MATISDFIQEEPNATEEGTTEKLQFAEDIMCDSCMDSPSRALKSCLTCLVSYCESHLRPHLENVKFQNHRLVEPLHDIDRPVCEAHRLPLERFCLDDGCCLCPDCEGEGHGGHMTAAMEEARAKIESELEGKQAELSLDVSETQKAIEKLEGNSDTLKVVWTRNLTEFLNHLILENYRGHCDGKKMYYDAPIQHWATTKTLVQDVCTTVEQQFTRLQKTVEEAKKSAMEVLDSEQKLAMRQSESIQTHLEQKRAEITKKLADTDKVLRAKSDIDFLQKYSEWKKTSTDVSLPSVHINSMEHLSSYEQTVTDTTQQLCELLLSSYRQSMDMVFKSGKSKPMNVDPSPLPLPVTREHFLKYHKSLTFNPDTIHNFLRVTEDHRKLTNTSPWQHRYPDHPSRFEHWRQALTSESLYLGRHYIEAELRGEGVHIGVTHKSIDPKGEESSSCICESEYSWCIGRKSKCFSVWHAGVETPLEATDVTTVGLYVDFQQGSVSFYKVNGHLEVLHRYEVNILEPFYVAAWLSKKDNTVRLLDINV